MFRLTSLCFLILHSRNPDLYLTFYKSFILPSIDYYSIFYISSLKSSLLTIERLQKRFTKRLYIGSIRIDRHLPMNRVSNCLVSLIFHLVLIIPRYSRCIKSSLVCCRFVHLLFPLVNFTLNVLLSLPFARPFTDHLFITALLHYGIIQ